MSSSKRLIEKATKKYLDGYIDDALIICEKCIADSIRNKAAINLKGLIMYLKGDIDSARAMWKINSEVNQDPVSKKYLNDMVSDVKRLKLYTEAFMEFEAGEIDLSIDILEKCRESDFNLINVNNLLAKCYISKGNENKAYVYLDRVIKADFLNYEARESLQKIGKSTPKLNESKTVLICTLLILAVLGVSLSSYCIFLRSKTKKANKSNITNVTLRPSRAASSAAPSVTPKSSPSPSQPAAVFPADKLKDNISGSDYESMYSILKEWSGKQVSADAKGLMDQASAILQDKGIDYFYKKGRDAAAAKDYNTAVIQYGKVFEYGENSFLYEHALYLSGCAYESMSDLPNSIKLFSQYDKSYPKGSYEDTVLYKLAVYYNDTDKSKAKDYAQRLVSNFPDSQYNNSVIKSILQNS